MNLPISMALILYWTSWILFLGVGSTLAPDSFGNPMVDDGFSTNADFNETGFDADTEIDQDTGGLWGFFSGIAGVFVALGRGVALVAFGLTTSLTGLAQIIVSTWATAMTLFTIFFIITAFWDG